MLYFNLEHVVHDLRVLPESQLTVKQHVNRITSFYAFAADSFCVGGILFLGVTVRE